MTIFHDRQPKILAKTVALISTVLLPWTVAPAHGQPCGPDGHHVQNYIITYNQKWLSLEFYDENISDIIRENKGIRIEINRIDSTGKNDLRKNIYAKWEGWHYNSFACKYSSKIKSYDTLDYKKLPCTEKSLCLGNCYNSNIISLSDSSIFIVLYLLNDYRNTYFILIDKNDTIKTQHFNLLPNSAITDDESYRKAINEYALKNYPNLNKTTNGKSIWDNYSGRFQTIWSADILTKYGFNDQPDWFILITDTTHHEHYKELSNTIVATQKWNILLKGKIAFHQDKPISASEDKTFYYVMLYDWSSQHCFYYPDMIPVLYKISKSDGKVVNTIRFHNY